MRERRKRERSPRGPPPPGRNRMTERVRGNAAVVVGMIVKTGLQDATKNVRIYGTISAASSPSARLFHRRRASRRALPVPLYPSPPPVVSSPPPRSSSLRSPPAVAFRETHGGSYFLSSACRCAPPYPLSTPPCPLSSSPPSRSAPERKGGPHHAAGAHSGARSPPPPRAPL